MKTAFESKLAGSENAKSPAFHTEPFFLRDLARIQTWNLLSRNQVLYSVELRGHYVAKIHNF
jgi:hypothetical protein